MGAHSAPLENEENFKVGRWTQGVSDGMAETLRRFLHNQGRVLAYEKVPALPTIISIGRLINHPLSVLYATAAAAAEAAAIAGIARTDCSSQKPETPP